MEGGVAVGGQCECALPGHIPSARGPRAELHQCPQPPPDTQRAGAAQPSPGRAGDNNIFLDNSRKTPAAFRIRQFPPNPAEDGELTVGFNQIIPRAAPAECGGFLWGLVEIIPQGNSRRRERLPQGVSRDPLTPWQGPALCLALLPPLSPAQRGC